MNELPIILPLIFIICTLYTLFLIYLAFNRSVKALLVSLGWIALQGGVAYSLFYVETSSLPPRVTLALLPAILVVFFFVFSKKYNSLILSLDLKRLYLIHVVRIPIEFGLYGLAMYKMIPALMTFEGMNFDIFAGISVPLIILGYFIKDWFSDSFVLFWNLICLGLLITIIFLSITSFESPFQTREFEQPNKAFLYFPYIWLVSYIVPVVLFSHLVCIKRAYTK